MKDSCNRLKYRNTWRQNNLQIPSKYILMKCLLNDLIYICPADEIYLYSEKGVLNQLTLFKTLTNKIYYIRYNNDTYLTAHKNKLMVFLFINNLSNKLLNFICMGYDKSELKKNYYWENIYPLKFKNMPKKLTFNQQYQWKKKHLSKSKLDKLASDFEKEYNEANNIITVAKNNKKLPAFKRRMNNKFKAYTFDKELKAIQNSIFYTCKVKKELGKLFPKFK